MIAGRALWFCAGKLAWPHPLTFFYDKWSINSGVWWQYLYPAAALAVMGALWLARERIGRGPLAAVLIFAGVLSPALGFFNVYPFLFSFVADHFQYHASIALIAAAAAALAQLANRWDIQSTWLAPAVAAAVLVPLAATAREKTIVYHDVKTLYSDTLALNPAAWAAHVNLAGQLQHSGSFDEAVEHYREALELNPSYGGIHVALGAALFLSGKIDEGQAEIRRGMATKLSRHDRVAAHVHLATILNWQRRFDEAMVESRCALAIRSDYAPALMNLGLALEGRGDVQGGIEKVREALAINPKSALAHFKLGMMLAASGKVAEAIESFQTAVQLQPANPLFQVRLADALIETGDIATAENHVRQALELNPQSCLALNLLGIIHLDRGDLPSAIAQFEAAVKCDPTDARARANLQRARAATHPSP